MTSFHFALLLMAFICVSAVPLVFAIRRRGDRSKLYYVPLCVSGILWGLCQVGFFILPNEDAALFIHYFRLMFVGYSGLFLFLLTLRVLRHTELSRGLLIALLLFPLLTGLIALTNPLTGLISSDAHMVYMSGVRMAVARMGVWFWLHCLFAYALMAYAAVLMLRQYGRLPHAYRSHITILLVSLLLTGVASVLSIMDISPFDVDFTPLTMLFSQVVYYVAVFSPEKIDVLISTRDTIFEATNYPLIIMDTEHTIVDSNPFAKQVAAESGFSSPLGMRYEDFLDAWFKNYNYETYKDDPSIFTLHKKDGDFHYQVVKHPLFDRDKKTLGTYIEIKNITPLMTLIHKLQDTAYYDEMTGLYSRNYFSHLCGEMSDESHLPLGILVGDVNGLKKINDTYGHARGDELIKTVASGLKTSAPRNTFLSRIGGDEFVALVPNTGEPEMRSFLEKLETYCADVSGKDFVETSIAAAFTIRVDMGRTIEELIREADINMYAVKKDRRRR